MKIKIGEKMVKYFFGTNIIIKTFLLFHIMKLDIGI